MPDDLTVQDPQGNTLETWDSTFGVDELAIPLGNRKAQVWKKMPSAFYNWVRKMTIARLNKHDDILRNRVLWHDVEEFFWKEESGTERPAVWATRNGFSGFVFRKNVSFDEAIYWQARNRYSSGSVELAVSAETANSGGIMFSVGVSTNINGPFTTYSPQAPLQFNPQAPQPMTLVIPTGTMTPGQAYYYRLVREYDHQGDTLNADVVVTEVKVR